MSHSVPGSPIDLTGTRRAFALDSRTVWVEQQIVMNGIVSKDNLFVGPMDYDPRIPERHVPVTTIARPKTVDTFHPYRGNTGGTAGLSKRGSSKLKTKKTKKKSEYQEPLGDIRGTLGANSRSEFVTVFSDHDKRMPIDPSRRYYITDKRALPVDPFLHSRFHCDGARGPVQSGSVMGKDSAERLRVKPAMPQSDSVYQTDTPLVNKRPLYGKIFPEAFTKNSPKKYDKESKDARAVKKAEKEAKGVPGQKTVERPPLRLRKQPVLEFDASCYELNKKEGGVNMTPLLSRNKAKVNVFHGMMTTKLGYKSKNIDSPLAERVRRNYM